MIAKRKEFRSRRELIQSLKPELQQPAANSTILVFPTDYPLSRKIDFGEFLNCGFDGVVDACLQIMREMFRAKAVRPATVVTYAQSGAQYFFRFLAQRGKKLAPQQITRSLVEEFIGWLRAKGNRTGGRNHYAHTKAILSVLARRGVFGEGMGIFPPNPYPLSNRRPSGERQLSSAERKRLADALRTDLIDIGKGRFKGTSLAEQTVLVLSLALRTGMNPQPLVDLKRNCIEPHPLIKGQYRIRSVKYRAKSVQRRTIRASSAELVTALAAGDTSAIVKFACDRSDKLRASADPQIADHLWLFRSEAKKNAGKTLALRRQHLAGAIRDFVYRHNLAGENGRRLRLNLSRIRKTMANSLWRLSGGDLRGVASAMGHTSRTTDDHYLEITPDMQRNHHFLGQALVDGWRERLGENQGIEIPNTPVGKCKDPYHGHLAPKNGNACIDFESCFRCKSYVLVEDMRDLHRLFSFYFFLDEERFRMRPSVWSARFGWIMALIDRVTTDRFDNSIVSKAKELALTQRHKFWSQPPEEGDHVEHLIP